MSLCEALLLEPPIPNLALPYQEVWIAARTDHLKGSGTVDDPFNGGTSYTSWISITSLTGNELEATAQTAQNHGFDIGQLVTIRGATGSDAHLWNGMFVITDAPSLSSFKYTLNQAPVETTAAGNPACAQPIYHFDEIMRAIQHHTAVHIGPGIFETKGDAGGTAGGWFPKSSQRIIGAGMGLTTLKLVGCSVRDRTYNAISNVAQGGAFLEGFEVSDLTVDCNADGPQPNPQTSCAAINLCGGGSQHVRIRRVRAIHYGSRASDGNYVENFVIVAGAVVGDDDYCDIRYEDCVAEMRSPNGAWNSTMLHLGGGEQGGGVSARNYWHKGCSIRNCYVDDSYSFGKRVSISQLSFTGNNPMTLTLTTAVRHGYTKPGNAVLSGICVQGGGSNPFNGVFAIANATEYQIVLQVPNTNGLTPIWSSNSRIGDTVPSKGIQVKVYTLIHVGEVGDLLYELETEVPHNRSINNKLRIGGVHVNNAGIVSYSISFNGLFEVVEVVSLTKLRFKLNNATDKDWPIVYVEGQTLHPIFIDNPSLALSADAGTAAVVEGNRVYSCEVGGPYHDTFSSGDLTARDNYYWDVTNSVMQNMGEQSDDRVKNHYLRLGSGLEAEGTVATFRTSDAHGLEVGDVVRVAWATQAQFNGYFVIKEVGRIGSEYFFKYMMETEPVGNSDPAYFLRFWQVNWLNIEGNIIECGPIKHTSGYGGPYGFYLAGVAVPEKSIFTFKEIVARENVISKSDIRGITGWDYRYIGTLACKAKNIHEQENVINLYENYGVLVNTFATASIMNNRRPSGSLLRAKIDVTGAFLEELENRINDALIFSL